MYKVIPWFHDHYEKPMSLSIVLSFEFLLFKEKNSKNLDFFSLSLF